MNVRFLRGAAVVVAGVLLAAVPPAPSAQDVAITGVEFGDRTVTITWNRAPGDTLTRSQRAAAEERLFARYRVWRAAFPDSNDFRLVRSYDLFDSTWTFRRGNELRVFADPDSIILRGTEQDPDADEIVLTGPHNGFQYYYAVSYDFAEIDSSTGTARPVYFEIQGPAENRVGPVQPARTARTASPLLDDVSVVPNPYNPGGFAGQQAFPGPPRVQFQGLPERCAITIYTAAGDKVRSLVHEDGTDSEDWDLRNNDGRDVAAGIYVYFVEAEGQTRRGRMVVVR